MNATVSSATKVLARKGSAQRRPGTGRRIPSCLGMRAKVPRRWMDLLGFTDVGGRHCVRANREISLTGVRTEDIALVIQYLDLQPALF
jgi:hypothetical protein